LKSSGQQLNPSPQRVDAHISVPVDDPVAVVEGCDDVVEEGDTVVDVDEPDAEVGFDELDWEVGLDGVVLDVEDVAGKLVVEVLGLDGGGRELRSQSPARHSPLVASHIWMASSQHMPIRDESPMHPVNPFEHTIQVLALEL